MLNCVVGRVSVVSKLVLLVTRGRRVTGKSALMECCRRSGIQRRNDERDERDDSSIRIDRLRWRQSGAPTLWRRALATGLLCLRDDLAHASRRQLNSQLVASRLEERLEGCLNRCLNWRLCSFLTNRAS